MTSHKTHYQFRKKTLAQHKMLSLLLLLFVDVFCGISLTHFIQKCGYGFAPLGLCIYCPVIETQLPFFLFFKYCRCATTILSMYGGPNQTWFNRIKYYIEFCRCMGNGLYWWDLYFSEL